MREVGAQRVVLSLVRVANWVFKGRRFQRASSQNTLPQIQPPCPNTCSHIPLSIAQAKQHGTRIIDEDGLFSLIAATSHLKPKEEQEEPLVAPAPGENAFVHRGCVLLPKPRAFYTVKTQRKVSMEAGPSRCLSVSNSFEVSPTGLPQAPSKRKHKSRNMYGSAYTHAFHIFTHSGPSQKPTTQTPSRRTVLSSSAAAAVAHALHSSSCSSHVSHTSCIQAPARSPPPDHPAHALCSAPLLLCCCCP